MLQRRVHRPVCGSINVGIMKVRKVNQQDLVNAENILVSLNVGRYEMNGKMAMAFCQALDWYKGVIQTMKQQQKTEAAKQAKRGT